MQECKLKEKFFCVQVFNKSDHIALEDIPESKHDRIEVLNGAKWIFQNQLVRPGDWIVSCHEGDEVQSDRYFNNKFELV